MNPQFDDKQESRSHRRRIPVEEGFDERDVDLTEHHLASGEARISRTPADVEVESEPRESDYVEDNPENMPLLSLEETKDLRSRWETIQVGFVDEPRRAVEEADKLVASAIERLAEIFSAERTKLERLFRQGNNVSTEDLRVALQRYRTFFSRLLSI